MHTVFVVESFLYQNFTYCLHMLLVIPLYLLISLLHLLILFSHCELQTSELSITFQTTTSLPGRTCSWKTWRDIEKNWRKKEIHWQKKMNLVITVIWVSVGVSYIGYSNGYTWICTRNIYTDMCTSVYYADDL